VILLGHDFTYLGDQFKLPLTMDTGFQTSACCGMDLGVAVGADNWDTTRHCGISDPVPDLNLLRTFLGVWIF